MTAGRDFVDWELEWGDYIVERLARLRELQRTPGHWGETSEEFGDLLDAFRHTEAMKPVQWWK